MTYAQLRTVPQLSATAPNSPSDTLEQARQVIEEKFLAAGSILARAVKGIEGLIASLETLTQTVSSDLVQATTAELKTAAEQLSRLPEGHATRTEHLENLRTHDAALLTQIELMLGALAYMRAITLNVRIVAGSQGGVGDEFAIFAEDIATCIAQCGEEVHTIDADNKTLCTQLIDAREQNGQLGIKIAQNFPALPNEISERAEAMGEHYRHVAETASQVTDLARDIRKSVARILLALQIGDITRQRIEHIQFILDYPNRVGETTGTATSTDMPTDLEVPLRVLAHAQLRATAADFSREVTEIGRAMATLADNARQLLKLHDLAYTENDSNHGGFLHRLASKIQQARDLSEVLVHTADDAAETGRASSTAVGQLSHRINEIQILKRDVQYMALNTTLKSCQIGNAGRPLSVVAQALREHAEHLDTAAGECMHILEMLDAVAAKLTAESGGGPNAVGGASTIIHRLDTAAARIVEAGEKTEANIVAITQKGDEVLHDLEMSTHTLHFREEIGDILDTAATQMSEADADVSVYAHDQAQAWRDLLDVIFKKYTMAQERDVHKQFVERMQICENNEAPPQTDDFAAVLF